LFCTHKQKEQVENIAPTQKYFPLRRGIRGFLFQVWLIKPL